MREDAEMKPPHTAWRCRPLRVLLITAALLLPLLAAQVQAAHEDVAMFYEELSPYGNWVDYGDYGPVWYPNRVTENWRPYLDGRWVPTEGGWVFESTEPWAWATYHYGNWMPTENYGWVWTPGSTWYPNTAAWRTSDDYIGWAPIPPPNYVPPPAYYPPGGYYPGMAPLDLISAPFWILARAASFLLGFGVPYAPAYSYYNCGCLAPFQTYPAIFPRTSFLRDYYYPAYAPSAFFFFGPSFPFVSRACNVPIVRINTFVREVNVVRLRNVLPPKTVLDRRPFFKEAIPAQVREGRWQARRVEDARRVQRLARPDALRPPRDLPRVPRLERATPELRSTPERVRPETRERRGVRLPPQAVPGDRDVRDQLRRERRLEQRQVPRTQQRQFQRQEQELRRQEIFRTPRARQPQAPRQRIQRPPQPRQAPQMRREQSAPRGRMTPVRPGPSSSRSGRGRDR